MAGCPVAARTGTHREPACAGRDAGHGVATVVGHGARRWWLGVALRCICELAHLPPRARSCVLPRRRHVHASGRDDQDDKGLCVCGVQPQGGAAVQALAQAFAGGTRCACAAPPASASRRHAPCGHAHAVHVHGHSCRTRVDACPCLLHAPCSMQTWCLPWPMGGRTWRCSCAGSRAQRRATRWTRTTGCLRTALMTLSGTRACPTTTCRTSRPPTSRRCGVLRAAQLPGARPRPMPRAVGRRQCLHARGRRLRLSWRVHEHAWAWGGLGGGWGGAQAHAHAIHSACTVVMCWGMSWPQGLHMIETMITFGSGTRIWLRGIGASMT